MVITNSKPTIYNLTVDPQCRKILELLKKQKPSLFQRLQKQVFKIVREPNLGKPLRHDLRNYRRIHMGSFVLLYEILSNEVRLVDFGHHDGVYAKYK